MLAWTALLVALAIAALLIASSPLAPFRALGLVPAMELAERYLRERRFMEAMVVAKKAIGGSARDPRPRLLLARIFVAQKKSARAIAVLEELLRLFPDHEDARAMLRELTEGKLAKE